MFAEERREKILGLIKSAGKVSVNELADEFDITRATIRQDLREICDRGLATKTHGGAIRKNLIDTETISDKRKDYHLNEKEAIGKLSASLVTDNQTIILDTGTTTSHIARYILDKKNLTVITNDFATAQILETSPNITIYILGGIVKSGYHCSYHSGREAFINNLQVDIAFMGANGISVDGATAVDIHLADTKRLMSSKAEKTVVCCDHSKFNLKSLAKYASIDELGYIVTDQLPDNHLEYEALGAQFLVVE